MTARKWRKDIVSHVVPASFVFVESGQVWLVLISSSHLPPRPMVNLLIFSSISPLSCRISRPFSMVDPTTERQLFQSWEGKQRKD
jgi:hypothetical protein